MIPCTLFLMEVYLENWTHCYVCSLLCANNAFELSSDTSDWLYNSQKPIQSASQKESDGFLPWDVKNEVKSEIKGVKMMIKTSLITNVAIAGLSTQRKRSGMPCWCVQFWCILPGQGLKFDIKWNISMFLI